MWSANYNPQTYVLKHFRTRAKTLINIYSIFELEWRIMCYEKNIYIVIISFVSLYIYIHFF